MTDGSIADVEQQVDLKGLFSPFTIKNVTLPNRFVLAGMLRYMCAEGRPLPSLAEFYRSRVDGGVGLVMTESCAVDHFAATAVEDFGWMREDTLDAWAACVAAVKNSGGNIIIQLWHEGARDESTAPRLSPSGLYGPGKYRGAAASAEDLDQIKDAFVRSARGAQQIGADGIEVHASGGGLLDEFLWVDTNRRTDGYGGDALAARLRYPTEIVTAIREAVGPDFLISFRFSQWKLGYFDIQGLATTPEELAVILTTLRHAGVDLFQPATSRFWTPEWPDSPLSLAGWTKKLIDAAVVAVGGAGLNTDYIESYSGVEASPRPHRLSEMAAGLAQNEFDLIAIGRALLADPAWVNKIRDGRHRDIIPFRIADLKRPKRTN